MPSSDQIIVVEVIETISQPEVVHYGNPGPRGPAGPGTSPETLTFDEGDWEDDPDNDGFSRLVLDINSYCLAVWETVGSDALYRSDTLIIRRETVDSAEKLVIRNGSDDTFAGFVSYVPEGE